jgi:PKD repeat protein
LPGTCSAIATWGDPTAVDNCGGVVLGSNYSSGDSFPLGDTTVTYVATDDSFNGSSISFTVTVIDEESPTFLSMPGNLDLNNTPGECNAMASWSEPVASDNCGAVTLEADYSSGEIFSVGDTTVTYTGTDDHGNSSQSSFTISVADTEDPTIDEMPIDVTVTASSGEDTASATWIEPVAIDNCGVIAFTSDAFPGDIFPVGTTSVNYIATDSAGNSFSDSFSVTVNDPPPVADFIATPMSGTYNLTVNFIDTSIGPITNWLWDFGDGEIAAVQSPTHVYTQEGDYTVTLVVSGPGGTGSMSCSNCIVVTTPPDYLIKATDMSLMEGAMGSAAISLDNNGTEIQAWSYGVCNDTNFLICLDVADGASIPSMNNGASPDFNIVQIYPDGFTAGVVISFTSSFALQPGFGYELNVATYEGVTEGATSVDFCDTLGTPAIGTVMVVNSQSVAPDQESGTVQVLSSD